MSNSTSSEAFDLDAAMARIQGHIDEETRTGFKATKATDVPVRVDDVTPQWLTAVLCSDHPGAAVTNAEIVGGSDGSTSRRSITLTYNDAGSKLGLPTRLFGKSTPLLQNRLVCGLSGAMFTERDFYNLIRPELSIEAPRAYFAAADRESFRSIMLFADMSEDGTVFTDPYYYIDRAKAEDMVTLLASFHAQLLESPLLDRVEKLKTSLEFQQDVNDGIDFENLSNVGIDRAASVIPESIKSRKHEMWNNGLMRSLQNNVELPNTLAHCDVHIGNWYCTGEGRMGLTDWQCAARGNGAVDLSYALLSGLTVADRRAWERDLVKLYSQKLAEFGSPDGTDFEVSWLRYRQQAFHAFYNWVYTIGAGDMQPDMQPDDISMLNIERMAAAIDDLESYQAMNG
jgi:thiamine kinase-like enzyme